MAYEFKDRLPLYEVYFLDTMGDYQNKSTSSEATTYNHFQVIWTLDFLFWWFSTCIFKNSNFLDLPIESWKLQL